MNLDMVVFITGIGIWVAGLGAGYVIGSERATSGFANYVYRSLNLELGQAEAERLCDKMFSRRKEDVG